MSGEQGDSAEARVVAECWASLDAGGGYPSASSISAVHKEECSLCFVETDSADGILVDLRSLVPFCSECATWNVQRTGNRLYLNIKKQGKQEKASEDQERPSKKQSTSADASASGGERTVMQVLAERHAAEQEEFDMSYSLVVLPGFESVPYPAKNLPPPVDDVISAIIAAEAAGRKSQLQQFEASTEKVVSQAALSLVQLDNGVIIPPDPSQWKCAKCDQTQNLWLNLTDGMMLCGRANWDGTGGNGHALAHYQETKYPLAVKLGTVARDLSTADVFSYLEDDSVVDPLLEQHLRHFGIDFTSMKKTEMTTAEKELEQNLSFEWNRIEERGQKLQPVFGPGLTGLRNLGNSCYLASTMQVLFATQPFISAFFSEAALRDAFLGGPADPTGDLSVQLVKLGHGLLSGKFSVPSDRPSTANLDKHGGGEGGAESGAGREESKAVPPEQGASEEDGGEQRGIPPRMFKAVIGRQHPEFSTSRQQDAFEFFQYLFELLQQGSSSKSKACHPFEFKVEEKIRCGASGKVSIKQREDNALSLPIPLEGAAASSEPESGATQDGPVPRPKVPLSACLEAFAAEDEIPNFYSTAIAGNTTAKRTTRFLTFPEFLVVHMRKYVVEAGSWTPKKLDVGLDIPLTLDLSPLRAPNGGGLQPGEELLPESAEERNGQAPSPTADPALVDALVNMGFPRARCEQGVLATANAGVEEAATWILTHDEDELPAAPQQEPGSQHDVDESDVANLMAFGFSETAARNALRAHGRDLEAAANWIFSNPEDAEKLPDSSTEAASSGARAPDSGVQKEFTDGPGHYELFAFISHMGSNTQCGHYVCHIKKDGKWVLFNDSKVALSEDPPVDLGYLYFYKRTGKP